MYIGLCLIHKAIDTDNYCGDTSDIIVGITLHSDTMMFLVTMEDNCTIVRNAKNGIQHFQWFQEDGSRMGAVVLAQCLMAHICEIIGLDNFTDDQLATLSGVCTVLVTTHTMEKYCEADYNTLIETCTNAYKSNSELTAIASFSDGISVPPEELCEKITLHVGRFTSDTLNKLEEAGKLVTDDTYVFRISNFHTIDMSLFDNKLFTIIL